MTQEQLNEEFFESNNLTEIADIINKGANIDTGKYGASKLSMAAARGDLEIVTLLINSGAKIDSEDDHYRVALIEASGKGDYNDGSDIQARLKVVKLLIEKGANVNAKEKQSNDKDFWGETALMG